MKKIKIALLVIALLSAGWTGAWLFLRAKAEQEVERWLRIEASMGRNHDCENRSMGGYPFHLTLRCSKARLVWQQAGTTTSLDFAQLTLQAPLWQPQQMTAYFGSPAHWRQDEASRALLHFSSALMRVHLKNFGAADPRLKPERLEVNIKDLRLHAAPELPMLAQADRIEIRLDLMEPVHANWQSFALKLNSRNARFAQGHAELGAHIDLEASLLQWPSYNDDVETLILRQWASQQGQVRMTHLRVERGTGLMIGSAEASLSPRGTWNGSSEAHIVDGPVLFSQLGIIGLPDISPMLLALPFMSPPIRVEERNGHRLRLLIKEGLVSFGRFQLGVLPQAFKP